MLPRFGKMRSRIALLLLYNLIVAASIPAPNDAIGKPTNASSLGATPNQTTPSDDATGKPMVEVVPQRHRSHAFLQRDYSKYLPPIIQSAVIATRIAIPPDLCSTRPALVACGTFKRQKVEEYCAAHADDPECEDLFHCTTCMHGTCDRGRCVCKPGYSGMGCENLPVEYVYGVPTTAPPKTTPSPPEAKPSAPESGGVKSAYCEYRIVLQRYLEQQTSHFNEQLAKLTKMCGAPAGPPPALPSGVALPGSDCAGVSIVMHHLSDTVDLLTEHLAATQKEIKKHDCAPIQ